VLYGAGGMPAITPLEWSPDSREILGTRRRSAAETDVVLMSTLDGSVRSVRTLEHSPGRVALSPDGRSIAYDRAEDADETDRGIFLSAIDGGEETPVVTGPTYDSQPMWTPDGSGLVFASMRTGGPGLWLQRIRDGRAEGSPVLLDKDLEPFAPITLTRRGSLFYNHRTGLMDVYTAPIDPSTGDVTGAPANAANRFLGSNLGADWSPDGNTLVFASWRTLAGPGRNILVFHSMDTGREREVTLDLDSVSGAGWSPDGRFIAVAGPDRKGVNAYRLMDPASGRIVKTLLARTGGIPFNSGAWDPDGAHAYLGSTATGRVSRLDVSTGGEEPVYEAPSDSVLGNLSVSPDGRWIAFGLFLRADKSARLRVIPSSGGGSRDLVNTPKAGAALRVGGWTRDGRQILFVRVIPASSEHGQIGELWAAPFHGGPARSLGLSQPALRNVRVSPTGDRISFTTGFPDRDIWVFENFLPKAGSR